MIAFSVYMISGIGLIIAGFFEKSVMMSMFGVIIMIFSLDMD